MISKLRSIVKSEGVPGVLTRIGRRSRRLLRGRRIPIGAVRWGHLRNLQPICPQFGFSRGKPVDRYYIESFIAEHAGDIRGRVLEIKDPGYTQRYGGSKVEQSDVLDINAANPAATIIADLNEPNVLDAGVYDCVIFTQTLQLLYDPRKVIQQLHRSLKPGGVLLLTIPGITPLRSRDSWYWSFTELSGRAMLSELFPEAEISLRSYGNVVTATAFLQGIAAGELTRSELAFSDPAYQLVIVGRAVKAER